MRSKDKGYNSAIVRGIPFFIGFLAGVFFLLLMGKRLLTGHGILGYGSLAELKYLTVNREKLFLYVMEIRWKTVILMIFLSVTVLGRLFCIACTAWYGFAFGSMLMAGCMAYRLKGMWFVLACQFPQILCYIPAYILLCKISRQLYECRYLHRIDLSVKEIASHMLMIGTMVFAGCLLESYVNPLIVMKLLKIF